MRAEAAASAPRGTNGWTAPWRYAAVLLIGLAVSLPFLVPIHLQPIPTFYSEWVAAALGLGLLALCVAATWRSGLTLPRITLLPAALLLVLAVQLGIGRIYFHQQALLYSVYLLFLACVMTAGCTLRGGIGFRMTVEALAGGLLLGALLQGVPALLQLQQVHLPAIAMPLMPGYGLYGNLAQANQFASYIWLGVTAALGLFWKGRIGPWAALAAIGFLVPLAALSGSRSVVLYPLGLLVLGLMVRRRIEALPDAGRLQRAMLWTAAWGLGAVFLLPVIRSMPGLEIFAGAPAGDPAARLIHGVAQVSGVDARVELWRTAWQATAAYPSLGHGVGAVPLVSLEHQSPVGVSFGVAEHLHNIVANLAVEFGLPVTLLAIWLLVGWVLKGMRRDFSADWVIALGLLTILAIHSQLEYPLWHTYYLLPAGLLLGAFSAGTATLRPTLLMRSTLLGAGFLAILLLHQLRIEHGRLWAAVALVPSGAQAEAIWRAKIDDLVRLHRESLFSPYVNGMLVVAMDTNRRNLADKWQVCNDALHFSPAPGVVFKCAAISALQGRQAEAESLYAAGIRAFPSQGAAYLEELDQLAGTLPELAPLLAYAASVQRR